MTHFNRRSRLHRQYDFRTLTGLTAARRLDAVEHRGAQNRMRVGLSHFSGCISDTEVIMSSDSVVLVGLDVHKDSIMVAYSVGFGDVENLGKISPRATDIDRLCKRMQSKA